jgi:2-polyprenyl-6-methoxyphenol hydroxylase-like FAD-dependent oxidoreductase
VTDVLVIGAGIGGLCLAQGLTKAGITDGSLNPKFAKPVARVEPGLSGFGVNRLTLREILLAGLDRVVHFGKTFERYESAGEGRVRARFADGTEVTADLLVGADGSNSAVRRQLLPGAVVDELHWATYGRTPIRTDTLDWVPDVLVDTFNRVTGPDDKGFAVATCRTREPVADAVARLAPGVHLTGIPDYLQWTVPLTDERLHAADPATLHRAAQDAVAGFHPAVRRIVAEADIPATFPVRVTSARPVEPWDQPNVTLLGDAIHTMSPGRGDGANIALKDAGVLCRTLAEGGGKTRYETEMLRYGFQAVADSLHRPFTPAASPRS